MVLRQISGRDLDYQFIQVIGSGGFGAVTKVRRVHDGVIMACKSIDCSAHPELERLASREIEAWASFGTEKYIAAFSNDTSWNSATETIRIYMDYYRGGDLQGVIDTCRHQETTIHPLVATYWAVEISRGIKACHDHGIIHRDIKPQNILLSMPYVYNDVLWAATNGQIQDLSTDDLKLGKQFLEWMGDRSPWCHLTDFGLGKFSTGAIVSRNTNASYGMVGTPGYIAPESMGADPVFSSKSDIYSLGCLLYVLCKCKPLPSQRFAGAVIPPISPQYPKKLQAIITSCLQQNPSARPTSREVVNELNEAFVDIVTSSLWTKTKAAFESRGGSSPVTSIAMPISPEQQMEKNAKLRDAIMKNDIPGVKNALAAGADANAVEFDSKGDSFLKLAAKKGKVPVVEALLNHGARLNYEVESFSAFQCAVAASHNEVARLLFHRGLITIDSRNEYQQCPIHHAARWGNLEMIWWLLKKGASLRTADCDGQLPIHNAARRVESTAPGGTEVIKYLLRKDPESVNFRDKDGNTPLHEAASKDREIVMLLCDAGADLFAKNNDGETPREHASTIDDDFFMELEREHRSDMQEDAQVDSAVSFMFTG